MNQERRRLRAAPAGKVAGMIDPGGSGDAGNIAAWTLWRRERA